MCACRPANRGKGIGADARTRDGEDITGERSDTTIAANRRATTAAAESRLNGRCACFAADAATRRSALGLLASDNLSHARRRARSMRGGARRRYRSTPNAVTPPWLPVRAERSSGSETAPWATKQKRAPAVLTALWGRRLRAWGARASWLSLEWAVPSLSLA